MTVAPTPIPHRHVAHPRALLVLGALVVAALAVGIVLAVRDNGGSTSTKLTGSGVAATQARTVPAFTAVDLAAANDVTVRVGDTQAVTVHADDNLIGYVTTKVESGTLAIGQSRDFTTSAPLSVEIGVPSLAAVTLTGAGVLKVNGIHADRFAVQMSGSGVLTVAGTVTSLDAILSGSGDVRLQGLAARDVAATVSGSGRLEINASRRLDATVSGMGSVVYSGNPTEVTKNVTGFGAITQR